MKKSIILMYFFLLLVPLFLGGQNLLVLDNCTNEEYEINDHQDADGDGNVCEAKLTLTKSASYTENEACQLSSIKWNVKVDLWKDGTDDLEFNSDLPPSDNSWDDTNGNGIPDIYIPPTANNEIQNIQLPDIEGDFSQHGILWKVTDECDLGDLCNASFTVLDKKAPTPFCVSLSTVDFNPVVGSPVEIFAEDYIVGTFDNCTPSEEITYSFSSEEVIESRTITCDDVINSPVQIEIYAKDKRGNVSSCTVFVFVNPGPLVDCEQFVNVSGKVESWKGELLEGVEVLLEANLPEFPRTVLTDEQGNYSFGLLPEGVDYTLSASFQQEFFVGLSTLDLVLIQRHILGLQAFSNPYRILASDVNNSQKVTAADLILHRKLILGIIDEVPNTTAWRFIDTDFEFVDPMQPFLSLSLPGINPYKIEFNTQPIGGFNFIGYKAGDVNE